MVILFLQGEGEIWEPNDYEVCKCSNGKQKCSERCPLEMKCKKVMQALYNLKKFSKNFNTTGYLLVGWNWRPLSILSVRGLAACKQEKNQIARNILIHLRQLYIVTLEPVNSFALQITWLVSIWHGIIHVVHSQFLILDLQPG